jgi:hypothetical protein
MLLNLQVEWTPCDLCGAEDWEVLFISSDRRHKLPGEFGVTKCRSCGHLQTNPRPTNEFLPTFYPESYSAHSAECHRIRHTKRDLHLMNLGRKFPFVGKMFSTAAAWRFCRLVPKWLETENGLFLEVGCGTGWLCALAWEMGWQAIGVDISLNACKVARQT